MKTICFYLPQYHPNKENDEWWGPGFTDWNKVASCRPRYRGHHQPHIPADLGFYDLRMEETRVAQANLARNYGIYGFCYYHYWFNGKILLDRPLDEVIESGNPDFPFCLCWANDDWTRAWDSNKQQILISQEYSEKDNYEHITWLLKAFNDIRYIKINGRPLFLIFNPDIIPNCKFLIEMWRKAVRQNDFPNIYLCAVKNNYTIKTDEEFLSQGFDAIVGFQPNRNYFPSPTNLKSWLYNVALKTMPDNLYQAIKIRVSANKLINYKNLVQKMIAEEHPISYREFPCVFPSWDNSARRKSAVIIQNRDPLMYEKWLADSIKKVGIYPEPERIVFINAWNEWAEGCHLEPDLLNQHRFLQATLNAIAFSVDN